MLKPKAAKMESSLEVYRFIGHPKGTRGGIFYSLEERKVFISAHANYLE